MKLLDKLDGENEQQYLWRIGCMKDNGLIDGSWAELTPLLNAQLNTQKNSCSYRKEFALAKRYKNNVFDLEDRHEAIPMVAEAELLKKQAQTKNLETNRWLRECARDSLILEEIKHNIDNLTPLDIPNVIANVKTNSDRVGVLCFGDAHFGTEFSIPNIEGGTINAYSPDIFYQRMEMLLQKTLQIIEQNKFDTIRVYEMGDFADGILRVSQLMQLRYGVIESTIRYANFISTWLNRLTQCVRVQFQMTHGNHTELRQIGAPKGAFPDDNMTKVVKEFVKLRLIDNPNFEFIDNPTGYIFDQIFDMNIMGIHGDCKDLNAALKDFSFIYNKKINYMLAGHRHHRYTMECGAGTELIGIPSLIGIDTYSMSLSKTSSPGATFLIFEPGVGKTVEYSISLKQ